MRDNLQDQGFETCCPGMVYCIITMRLLILWSLEQTGQTPTQGFPLNP